MKTYLSLTPKDIRKLLKCARGLTEIADELESKNGLPKRRSRRKARGTPRTPLAKQAAPLRAPKAKRTLANVPTE